MTGDDIPEGSFLDVPGLIKPFTVADLRQALERMLAG
jgi:hypothetical protein